KSHQFREHFGARYDRNVATSRLTDFRVVGTNGGRRHDDVGSAYVAGVVARPDAHAKLLQTFGDVRPLRVGPRHLVTEIGEKLRDATHADTPDTHEMNPPCAAKHSLPESLFRFNVSPSTQRPCPRST